MPYEVRWDDEETRTVACLTYRGRWTWDEWITGHDDLGKLIRSVEHRVDVIEAFHSMMPRGNAVPQFQYSGSTQPPNARHTVFVNQAGPLFKHMVDMVVNTMGWPGPTFCPTHEAALAYLAQQEPEPDPMDITRNPKRRVPEKPNDED